jgi:hypothetical protein
VSATAFNDLYKIFIPGAFFLSFAYTIKGYFVVIKQTTMTVHPTLHSFGLFLLALLVLFLWLAAVNEFVEEQ